ncbi:hypothetical protein PG987_006678 [Apiospora arundinis]
MCHHTNWQSFSASTAGPRCPCAESVEILLEAGCMLEFRELAVTPGVSPGFVSDAVVAYANELVRQRNQLKQIAKLYLPESRHEDLGLDSSAILDANGFRVVETLQKMRISLGPKLHKSINSRDGESIFHRIMTPEWAEFFYNLGFKDLSACTDNPRYIDGAQYFKVRCDATEVQEIQSENSDEIERFHQIVDSLTEELKSVFAGNLNIDLGSAKNYIETTWMERMKLEMKNDSEEDIEELVERTRELGVVWQGPLPSDSVHDDGPYRPTMQQITSLEFWMDEADRIVRGRRHLLEFDMEWLPTGIQLVLGVLGLV